MPILMRICAGTSNPYSRDSALSYIELLDPFRRQMHLLTDSFAPLRMDRFVIIYSNTITFNGFNQKRTGTMCSTSQAFVQCTAEERRGVSAAHIRLYVYVQSEPDHVVPL